MSRIGKKPIPIPPGVKVSISGSRIQVQGPQGSLAMDIASGISVAQDGQRLLVSRPDNERASRANQGMTRALIQNMVRGVHEGFRRALEINGVGYRAETKGQDLILYLGYSHPVTFPVPAGIKVAVEKNTKVILSGVDRELVGRVAARIRALRRPDPYKAKGIIYEGEIIKRKAGKKAVGTTA